MFGVHHRRAFEIIVVWGRNCVRLADMVPKKRVAVGVIHYLDTVCDACKSRREHQIHEFCGCQSFGPSL